jgi:hypothetical protein
MMDDPMTGHSVIQERKGGREGERGAGIHGGPGQERAREDQVRGQEEGQDSLSQRVPGHFTVLSYRGIPIPLPPSIPTAAPGLIWGQVRRRVAIIHRGDVL